MNRTTRSGRMASCLGIVMLGFAALTPAHSAGVAEGQTLAFDRAKLHAQAVEESLKPIRPGVPGKVPFWNKGAGAFIYAPAFEFKPVQGATCYRFTVTGYGTKSWSFDAAESKTSLEPIWKELPAGKLLVEVAPLDDKGNVRWAPQDLKPSLWLEKAAAGKAAPLDFNTVFIGPYEKLKNAAKYRYTVWAATELTFEADAPWAPLSPVWKDVPVGEVVLKIEGLAGKGGKSVGLARMEIKGSAPRSFWRFRRKAVFNGPYHEAASDYTDGAYRWLKWVAEAEFKAYEKPGMNAGNVQYPSKFVGAAVSGLSALAAMEKDDGKKKRLLEMAGNAAKALIATSFSTEYALAHFPPTYAEKEKHGRGVVMMNYPAMVGTDYLDLYELAGGEHLLAAAKEIAETYRKTQLPNGTWHHMVDAKTGEKAKGSESLLMPDDVLVFLERLAKRHGFKEYLPLAEKAWGWIREDPLANFRFQGQFEDQGSSPWNLSGLPACHIANCLFRRFGNDPAQVALAEEALRFAEDQFVPWEQPVEADVNRDQFRYIPFTPCALEQYAYMVPVNGSCARIMETCQAAWEATGKELYLAKAVAFANAMTVIQKENGGTYVGTFWNPGGSGGWPNCHTGSARKLAELGTLLQARKLRVSVNPNATLTQSKTEARGDNP